MKVLEAHGDTPLAQAARDHAAAGQARTCCEEHARVDVMNMRLGPVGREPTTEEITRGAARLIGGSMAVRAKFRVIERTERTYSSAPAPKTQESVKLIAVTDEANKSWAKYTPSGSIEMSIDNPAALDQFKVGDVFFVDFTPAPATEAEERA